MSNNITNFKVIVKRNGAQVCIATYATYNEAYHYMNRYFDEPVDIVEYEVGISTVYSVTFSFSTTEDSVTTHAFVDASSVIAYANRIKQVFQNCTGYTISEVYDI